jgi:hypothetical protein
MNRTKLRKMIEDFVPEFGNEHHLSAIEIIKKLKRIDKMEDRKRELDDDIAELEDEIKADADHLEFLINKKN